MATKGNISAKAKKIKELTNRLNKLKKDYATQKHSLERLKDSSSRSTIPINLDRYMKESAKTYEEIGKISNELMRLMKED